MNETSPSECLASYLRPLLGAGSYLYAEVQSLYSTFPAQPDWANFYLIWIEKKLHEKCKYKWPRNVIPKQFSCFKKNSYFEEYVLFIVHFSVGKYSFSFTTFLNIPCILEKINVSLVIFTLVTIVSDSILFNTQNILKRINVLFIVHFSLCK